MIAFRRLIFTADTHTEGEPTRFVIGGIIHYPGETILDKRAHIARELDWVRKSLMGEPRGHQDMFGAFVTPPGTDTGDLGVVFMDNSGYLDMCGHGTIGLCTMLVELGLVEATPPRTEIRIDTPAGRVVGYAHSENGQVTRAGFQSVPSFCLGTDIAVDVDDLGRLEVSIAYGGNFFAILPAESVDLHIDLANIDEIRRVGMAVKRAVNQQLEIVHPLMPEVTGVTIVTFYQASSGPRATYRNVHVFSEGQVDRSPGGTGTSAMLAYLIKRGEIAPGQTVVAEGPAGGFFEGRTVSSWQTDRVAYHTPDISSTAVITGTHAFLLDRHDPIGAGFIPG